MGIPRPDVGPWAGRRLRVFVTRIPSGLTVGVLGPGYISESGTPETYGPGTGTARRLTSTVGTDLGLCADQVHFTCRSVEVFDAVVPTLRCTLGPVVTVPVCRAPPFRRPPVSSQIKSHPPSLTGHRPCPTVYGFSPVVVDAGWTVGVWVCAGTDRRSVPVRCPRCLV